MAVRQAESKLYNQAVDTVQIVALYACETATTESAAVQTIAAAGTVRVATAPTIVATVQTRVTTVPTRVTAI